MTDAPRPADPLSDRLILAIFDAAASDEAGSYYRFLDALSAYVAHLDATRAPRSDDALRAALARAEAIDTLDYYEDSGSDSFNYDRYREDVVRAATAPPSPDEWTDPKG